jgi:methylmalonyl-CoA mutase
MTPEYGAASQLEKIDMLDFADVVAINKFERRGAEDALREVRRQVLRNHEAFGADPESLPVFGTVAARFNDDGVTALYQHLRNLLVGHGLVVSEGALAPVTTKVATNIGVLVPANRTRYLAEIAETVRSYHATTVEQVDATRATGRLEIVRDELAAAGKPVGDVEELLASASARMLPATVELLEHFEKHRAEERPTR